MFFIVSVQLSILWSCGLTNHRIDTIRSRLRCKSRNLALDRRVELPLIFAQQLQQLWSLQS
jgi:hypothetical protein